MINLMSTWRRSGDGVTTKCERMAPLYLCCRCSKLSETIRELFAMRIICPLRIARLSGRINGLLPMAIIYPLRISRFICDTVGNDQWIQQKKCSTTTLSLPGSQFSIYLLTQQEIANEFGYPQSYISECCRIAKDQWIIANSNNLPTSHKSIRPALARTYGESGNDNHVL